MAQTEASANKWGRAAELSDMNFEEGFRQKNRNDRDSDNSVGQWGRDAGFEGSKNANHDPLPGDPPSLQQAMQTAADYAHKTQGFTDPEYLNGKAQEKLMQLGKEGVDIKNASPQLIHMYVTGDALSQAYAMMRLSGVMDENGAMRRLPGIHMKGQQ
jgi:hypothetical protein